jgi:hypothetical protein
MARPVKTVSIRQLQAAVKSALEAAKKAHPNVRIDPPDPSSGGQVLLPVSIRFPWFCGLPPFPWPEVDLGNLAALREKFNSQLQANPQISAAALDGKFQSVVTQTGGLASIGFVPSDFAVTE